MRPGQYSAVGRCSVTIFATGTLSSRLTGTLIDRRRLKPASSNTAQSRSAVMSACSVRRAMVASSTPGRKVSGSCTPCLGWRMRASASAPARQRCLMSILG